VHPHVKKLLDLQRVDQEIASLRKDLDSLPAEEAKRRKRLDELERQRVEKKERSDKAEVESRGLEKGIKGGDDEVKKLTERLGLVRNNAEYQATLFQIESVKRERDLMQEQCIELLDKLEGYKAEAEAVVKAATEERAVFDAFLVEAKKLRESRTVAVAKVTEKRAALLEGIPLDLLNDYMRLFGTRNSLAVCSVEGGYCQGCYNRITTNDLARLMGGSSVVQCDSCQRILYLDR
jgi:predicted  nucleic acid-binding Zn-ribbon protein